MSLTLQNKPAGMDLGQASGVARPTPSPSGAPAPSAAEATRNAGQVNELRSRSEGSRPDPNQQPSRADVVQLSSVAQNKAALATAQSAKDQRVNESQRQPYKAVFQTLTAKVQFAKSESGEVIVQIVDSRTQEVVRQLPSEAFLKMQSRLEQMAEVAGEKEKGVLLETAV